MAAKNTHTRETAPLMGLMSGADFLQSEGGIQHDENNNSLGNLSSRSSRRFIARRLHDKTIYSLK